MGWQELFVFALDGAAGGTGKRGTCRINLAELNVCFLVLPRGHQCEQGLLFIQILFSLFFFGESLHCLILFFLGQKTAGPAKDWMN